MTKEETYRRILQNHLPPDKEVCDAQGETHRVSAVAWVFDYLQHYKVHFHITRERRTKLGDYRWPQGERHPFHEISVNGDLNPYRFLWVFIHEAAHLETHQRYGNRVAPHGHEWQGEYCRLLREQLTLFPSEVQPLVAHFARRIPMERAAGRAAENALRRYDPDADPDNAPLVLDDLSPNATFTLKSHPDRRFRALERRRTRWLCLDLVSERRYLVSGSSAVVLLS